MKTYEQLTILDKFFSKKNCLLIKKDLIKVYNLEMATYISFILDQYYHHLTNGKLIENNWFCIDNTTFSDQTGMSSHILRKCKEQAIKIGLITVQKKGIPPKLYYRVNLEMLKKI